MTVERFMILILIGALLLVVGGWVTDVALAGDGQPRYPVPYDVTKFKLVDGEMVATELTVLYNDGAMRVYYLKEGREVAQNE